MIVNKLHNTDLKKSDFWYDLPEELIAQTPLKQRDSSRLLVLNRDNGIIEHRIFKDIVDYFNEGDVLVINNSKVIPARLIGKKSDSGIDVEVFLLKNIELDVWEVMTYPGRRTKIGTSIVFADGKLRAEVIDIVDGGNRIVRFDYDKSNTLMALIDEIGNMPLPPYIKEKLEDSSRYQTVYAKYDGSSAAPTAGLHFTEELFAALREKGVKIAPVMLHVGLGTFRPVKEEKIMDHVMHSEYFSVSKESADIINNCKKNGGRVIAVGTTSCRTLESASDNDGTVKAMSGDTGIFIYPGYKFKVVDKLITNFHLPESTLMMLVSAFSNRETVLDAYRVAVEEKYRFFSFGDAMLIL
ncbi:MAG: tRNA preQ1(34) S-adenosylmethionine ribosyltransferase-isomerase QueA [Ruminococcaceae bacterium]|nr:tRNA preQ1(34) S-adenosylmethionine ribosyltransferase-isomerase QueA [Oscillospiraceae bacterium]